MDTYLCVGILIFCVSVYAVLTIKLIQNRKFLNKKILLSVGIPQDFTGYIFVCINGLMAQEIQIIKEVYDIATSQKKMYFLNISDISIPFQNQIFEKIPIDKVPAVFYVNKQNAVELFNFEADFLYHPHKKTRKKAMRKKLEIY